MKLKKLFAHVFLFFICSINCIQAMNPIDEKDLGSPSVQTLNSIKDIYNSHGLGDQIVDINFYIWDHETMLPESAYELGENTIKGEGSFISLGNVENHISILLSPCLNKLVEAGNSINSIKALTIYLLLSTLGSKNYPELFNAIDDAKQLHKLSNEFAIKHMFKHTLKIFKECLKSSGTMQDVFTLICDELEMRKRI